jgi:hypothetical protein
MELAGVKVAGRKVLDKFFQHMTGNIYKCNLCLKDYIQKPSKGYGNLCKHILSSHCCDPEELLKFIEGKISTLSMESLYSSKERNMFAWIIYISESLRPFNTVEDKRLRAIVKLEPISVKTVIRQMHLLSKRVEQKIQRVLPNKFALVFDGWTDSSKHFTAVFATFPDETKSMSYQRILLSFSPYENEGNLSAESLKDHLLFVLSLYEKNMNNVVCLIADNCNTNAAAASMLKIFFIGCYSHKLNLAVKIMVDEHKMIILKISNLMIRLG